MQIGIQNINFSNKSVLIIGDVILDKFIDVVYEKSSPEYLNTDILKVKKNNTYLGGAANVANNIKQLGATPYLVGVIGRDFLADSIDFIQLLKSLELVTDFIIYSEYKTTTKVRFFKNGEPLVRIDDESEEVYSAYINQRIIENIKECIGQNKSDAVILQDYNKGVLNPTTITAIIDIANRHNIPVFVDPKFENWNLYKNIFCIKPNKIEFEEIAQRLSINSNKIEYQLKSLKEFLNAENIFVTLGKEGNIFIDKKNKIQWMRTLNKNSNADVCGAGDSVIAMICLSFLVGNDAKITAYLANLVGFIACSNRQVYAVTFEDVLKIVEDFR